MPLDLKAMREFHARTTLLGRNVTQERNGLLAELESLRAEVARLKEKAGET